jgi:hypothetical protein
LIKEECAYFLERTHLDQTRPESKDRIDFTVPGGYRRLLNHIRLHRYLLEQEQGEPLADDEERAMQLAAASWYDNVYLPLVKVVQKTDILKQFPGRSESDLYSWLIKNQAALRQQHNLKDIDDLPSAAGFWLAYVEKLATSSPNLDEIELPKAAEDFLESIDDEKT